MTKKGHQEFCCGIFDFFLKQEENASLS